jgi:hypothetical protein
VNLNDAAQGKKREIQKFRPQPFPHFPGQHDRALLGSVRISERGSVSRSCVKYQSVIA